MATLLAVQGHPDDGLRYAGRVLTNGLLLVNIDKPIIFMRTHRKKVMFIFNKQIMGCDAQNDPIFKCNLIL